MSTVMAVIMSYLTGILSLLIRFFFFFFSSPLTSDVMQFTSMFQMTTTKYSQIENHLYKTVSSDPAIFKRMDRGSVSNYCSPSSHDPIGII